MTKPAALEISDAFGVNVHLKRFDVGTLQRARELIARLGAGRVRLVLDWYQPEEIELLAPFARGLHEDGVQILGSLENLVPGTIQSVLFPQTLYAAPLERLDRFLEWTAAAVKGLGPWISEWEILNETNTPRFWIRTPSAREYMDLLVPTAKLIRTLAPDARVMLGSLCGNDVSYLAPVVHRHYLKELLALGAMEHVDLAGFHPYTGDCYVSLKGEGATARGVELGIERFFEAYPGLAGRAWITEIGISRGLVRLSYQQIGRIYARWVRGGAARGVPVYLWCLQDFDDPEYGPLNPERTFGLAGVDLRINETGLALVDALGL